MQLLAEFKKLGAKVVYASFGKLIMATPKVSMSNALSYTQFIFDVLLFGLILNNSDNFKSEII